MTIITGYTDGRTTWLAADRYHGDGRKQPYIGKKILERDGWAVANAGESWTLDIARMDLDDEVWRQSDPHVLMRAWWKALEEARWEPKRPAGQPLEFDCWCLLARAGRLWSVYQDGYPHEVEPGRPVAHGSGAEVAAGAMWAKQRSDMDPAGLVSWGVLAASTLLSTCGCGSDLLVLEAKEGDSAP